MGWASDILHSLYLWVWCTYAMHMRTSEDIFQGQPVFHPVWSRVSWFVLLCECEKWPVSSQGFLGLPSILLGLLRWQTGTIVSVFHVGFELKSSYLCSKHFNHRAIFPVQHYPFHYKPCLQIFIALIQLKMKTCFSEESLVLIRYVLLIRCRNNTLQPRELAGGGGDLGF